jgi:hypothetical protein
MSCSPSTAGEAEKKHDIAWLAHRPSPEAVGALGRLADTDVAARDALEKLGTEAIGDKTLPEGAKALDIYLAAWSAVERGADWGTVMLNRALEDRDRMNDAASALKRGSPKLEGFVPELDAALRAGCDVRCGSAMASGTSETVLKYITSRLLDDHTREAMCGGIGSQDSSKEARGVFMHVPDSSRNGVSCPGAAARMAARDDDTLVWLAKSAEPGLLRATGTSDALPCDRVAKLWTMAFTSREHAAYGALAIPLGAAVKRCAKALDDVLSGAVGSDADAQGLAVAAIDPLDPSVHDLVLTCVAMPAALRGGVSLPMRARAQDVLAHCNRR